MIAHPTVEVVRDKTAILALSKPLEEFARLCGQHDSLHWMEYLLQNRKMRRASAYLVLVRKPHSQGRTLQASDLEGAALYFEYGIGWLRSWSFVSDGLVAREADRGRVAALATEAVLACGAHIVATSYRRESRDLHEPGPLLETPRVLWAQQSRENRRSVRLAATYEDTLSRFGKSTRFNFRYYRKRFIARYQPEFLATAGSVMSESDAVALNTDARNPVSATEARQRWDSAAHQAGSFLVGLRGRDGRWISAIGGWRSGDVAVLRWQANSKRFTRDSVINVMRAFFLEYLAAQGVRELCFIGGTTHSMHHSFEPEISVDVFVRRKSKRAWLLGLLAQPFGRFSHLLGNGTFLANGLRSDMLQWHASRPRPVPPIVRKSGNARARQTA